MLLKRDNFIITLKLILFKVDITYLEESELKHSKKKIMKSISLSLRFDARFNRFIVGSVSGKTTQEYYVYQDRKSKKLECSCHWYIHRTKPDRDRWGYCGHILRVLYEYDRQGFDKDILKQNE